MSLRPFAEDVQGLRIPGGCDDCDAFQTVDTSQAPVYLVRVHHDEGCPTLLRHQQSEVK